ncbi:MAG: beta-lactamase family protein [Candidatus Heimdallarchaeota archaeon]|nr:beta-lactamase family protein [Candidatus Heimdallarchaeota archaeon]
MPDEQSIQEKIEQIMQNLPGIGMVEGIPTPNWDETGTIEQEMEKYNVPGVSIAIVNNFEIEWSKFYGIQDKESNKKITKETLFEAGSTSKMFTAIAALSLVEKNLVDLDEPANDYLKSWKIPDNEFTAENPVTLRQLLTHTSGMNRPDSMFGVEEGETVNILQVLTGESTALNDPATIEKIPGSEHQYSNIAYIVIEKLLQDVLQKETSEIMKELIFNPVEMKQSLAEYPSDATDIILPHDNEGHVKKSGYVKGTFGCAGLLSTPEDIARFTIDIMKTYQGKSSKIISQSTLKEMLKAQPELDPAKFFGWTGQGLGVFLIEEEGDLFFTHPGTNSPGAVCMMIGNPKTGQGLVMMSNGIMAELLHIEILFAVSKAYDWSVYNP